MLRIVMLNVIMLCHSINPKSPLGSSNPPFTSSSYSHPIKTISV
jgi:hypothetical protein